MEFTSNTIKIFKGAGTFYAKAKVTCTQNIEDRKFTVKIDGVKGHCNVGWNFDQHIELWIADNKAGNNCNKATGKIGSSGSNSYTGWMPRNGYGGPSVSKTFKYNDDGTVPPVWIYFKSYNDYIYHISADSMTSTGVSFKENISSNIPKIQAKDNRAPKLTLNDVKTDKGKIKWDVSSDLSISKWEYKLNNNGYSRYKENTKNGSYELDKLGNNKHTIRIKGTRENGKSDTVEFTRDIGLPKISNIKTELTSDHSFKLSFDCDINKNKIEHRVLKGDNVILKYAEGKGNSSIVSSNLIKNINQDLTLEVRIRDNTSLKNSKNFRIDTLIPTLNNITTSAKLNDKLNLLFLSPFNNLNYKLYSSDNSITFYKEDKIKLTSVSKIANSVNNSMLGRFSLISDIASKIKDKYSDSKYYYNEISLNNFKNYRNKKINCKLVVTRNDVPNNVLYNEYKIIIDTILPKIEHFEIINVKNKFKEAFINDHAQATVRVKVNINSVLSLGNTNYGVIKSGEYKDLIVDINEKELNKIHSCNFMATRSDNSNLYTLKEFKIDTQYPHITECNLKSQGNDAILGYEVDNKNINYRMIIKLFDITNKTIYYQTILNHNESKGNHTIRDIYSALNVKPGTALGSNITTYRLDNNNLGCSRNSQYIQSGGGIYINIADDDNIIKPVYSSPYIYIDGKWKPVKCNIYNKNNWSMTK